MSKLGEYYDFVSEISLRHMNDKLEEENKEETMDDAMINAAIKYGFNGKELLDLFKERGLVGIYHLGMKHMYQYLKE